MAILAVLYFIAGKLGLHLALVHPSATAVWPPTGITIWAFLVLGYRVWPGILLGAFLTNITTTGSVATCLGIASGNTLEGLAGAYLVTRFARGSKAFERAPDTLRFALLAGMLSPTVSATLGVTSLALGGSAAWSSFGSIWFTWWLGDAVGAVLVAPLIILWTVWPHVRWKPFQYLEAMALLLSLVFMGKVVFSGDFLPGARNYPMEYLCVPFILWAAFRFTQRESATVSVVLSGIAIWGTFRGFGPFVRETRNESLLLLQAFTGVMAVTGLSLATVVAERRQAEEEARRLAVSDPPTGLANYRKLMETLSDEIKRFSRTARPFALLLLDLDGLKAINDNYGHLVGTQAICRLAEVLRANCRSVDTPARYGGDEFAVVLAETGHEAAQQVARRVLKQLAEDGATPPISVSFGAAEYPRHGDTIEELMNAADQALYAMKRRVLSHEQAGRS